MATEKRLIDARRLRYELDILQMENYGGMRQGIADAIGIVNMMPTVDAVEVVHGWWHKNWSGDNIVYCSQCYMPQDMPTQYCSSCGAKMDGGDGSG